jgi:hypothetical protein
MKKIVLKESQLNRLIKECVKDVLSEENKFTSVNAIYEGRKRRKEAFISLHKKAKTANEDVMKRFYGLLANHNTPVRIDEITIDRLLKKHGGNGMVNISANKTGLPQEINDENTKSLIRDLRQSGFSYLPTYGGYRAENGVEDDYEPSFVVFNYDTKGNARDFDDLKQFALAMCKKYDQDSVLVKAPEQVPVWLDRDGNKANARESEKYWKNDPKQPYFTSFKSKDAVESEIREKLMGKYKTFCHRNNLPITKDGFDKFYKEHLNDIDTIGKRYTYDIGFNECYVNPIPSQLSERMRRVGEVMIWE